MLGLTTWGSAALWIDGTGFGSSGRFFSLGFALVSIGLLAVARPLARAAAGYSVLFLIVLGWWLSLEPSNERDWLADVAHPPTAVVAGDVLTVHNLRNFTYRSEADYDPHWETRSYDLSELRGVDLFLSTWGSPWIAHTIVSWDFGGGKHLAISIETRKEIGESYSALLGFFRQFELYYVAADERDLIGVRASHRAERIRLYRLRTPVPVARDVLLDYVDEMNHLAESPRWYNALTHNCTTAIRYHVQNVAPGNPFNWRILLNGAIDELGYMRGNLDTSLPFEELRRLSDITDNVRASGDASDFSLRIRQGLPGARPQRSAPEGEVS